MHTVCSSVPLKAVDEEEGGGGRGEVEEDDEVVVELGVFSKHFKLFTEEAFSVVRHLQTE